MVEMHVYVKFKHEIQQQKTAEGSQEQNIWIKLQLIRAHMEIGAQRITPRLCTSCHSRSDAVITGPILSEIVRIRTRTSVQYAAVYFFKTALGGHF